jgi:hypothetical protein
MLSGHSTAQHCQLSPSQSSGIGITAISFSPFWGKKKPLTHRGFCFGTRWAG